ncbi:hypothetical protein GHT06_019869 [Daphnia sinensis]|uniref:Uncharacterized protein n=1 Tax=Daphnia sinensis TaxID=1820382 RepID=A0AAD5PP06_9CRUS|nr:hypothetical protein GHT06_019869 [Daphnia sinensis]
METIDFGCQVRCLNRQRLIPGSSHPQLNQCASQFLAKVRKEVTMCDPSASSSAGASSKSPEVGWMKLKLSERGLRILPPVSSSSSSVSSSCASSTTSSSSASASFGAMRSQQNRKSDEGFESDSDTSIRPHKAGSGGCSSGVNSSSSDMDESDEGRGGSKNKKTTTLDVEEDSSDSDSAEQTTLLFPIRCPLSDILSCQHPAALGRHVVLLTLRSADDSALDILALECSAQEPARILTMLCQKIQASAGTRAAPPPSCAAAAATVATNDVTKTGGAKVSQASSAGGDGPAPKTAAVSIQSWSEREDRRTLDAILVDSKHSAPLAAAGAGAKAHNIIRKLERQHSEWSLIQRRTRDGLTHLQVSKHKSTSAVAVGGDVAAAAATRGHFNGSVPTATSGAMLNNSNNSKKGMPGGDQMARLEQPALAITNSNQGHGSRVVSSGVDGVAAVSALKRSDTSVIMHQKLSKTKSSGSSASTCSSPPSSSTSPSCILSLQTPELPLSPSVTALSPAVVTDASTSPSPPPPLPQSLPPAKTSRWSFGAPFRQQQQRVVSPEASRRNAKSNQRGRSCERKSCKMDACSTLSAPQSSASDLAGLFVSSSGMLSIKSNNNNSNNKEKKKSKSSKSLPELLPVQSVAPPKLKRDPSKTRSFLMKLTSSSRKSPTPPAPAGPPPPPPLSTLSLNSQRSGMSEREHRAGQQQQQQHPLKLQSRGRSLIRLRSSTRLQSPPPPATSNSGQTFLIPTKSGQELTRNIYPKEGPAAAASQLQQQQQQQQQPLHQPVFHLLSGHTNNQNASGLGMGRLRYNAGPPVTANGWAGYCWNDPSGASLVRHSVPTYAQPSSIDPNNNQHQQQQQWIYFHPHHRHPLAMPAPPQLQPPPTLMKAGDFNKLRLQRSRSQSPGRMRSSQRWLPAAAPAGPSSIGHYYAVPTPMHHQQQPVSLPPDVGLVLSQQHRPAPACNSPANSGGNHQELSASAARSFRRSKSTHTRMSTRSHLTPLSSSKSTNHNNNNNNNNNKAVTFHAFATVQLVD